MAILLLVRWLEKCTMPQEANQMVHVALISGTAETCIRAFGEKTVEKQDDENLFAW